MIFSTSSGRPYCWQHFVVLFAVAVSWWGQDDKKNKSFVLAQSKDAKRGEIRTWSPAPTILDYPSIVPTIIPTIVPATPTNQLVKVTMPKLGVQLSVPTRQKDAAVVNKWMESFLTSFFTESSTYRTSFASLSLSTSLIKPTNLATNDTKDTTTTATTKEGLVGNRRAATTLYEESIVVTGYVYFYWHENKQTSSTATTKRSGEPGYVGSSSVGVPTSDELDDILTAYFSFWGGDNLQEHFQENGWNVQSVAVSINDTPIQNINGTPDDKPPNDGSSHASSGNGSASSNTTIPTDPTSNVESTSVNNDTNSDSTYIIVGVVVGAAVVAFGLALYVISVRRHNTKNLCLNDDYDDDNDNAINYAGTDQVIFVDEVPPDAPSMTVDDDIMTMKTSSVAGSSRIEIMTATTGKTIVRDLEDDEDDDDDDLAGAKMLPATTAALQRHQIENNFKSVSNQGLIGATSSPFATINPSSTYDDDTSTEYDSSQHSRSIHQHQPQQSSNLPSSLTLDAAKSAAAAVAAATAAEAKPLSSSQSSAASRFFLGGSVRNSPNNSARGSPSSSRPRFGGTLQSSPSFGSSSSPKHITRHYSVTANAAVSNTNVNPATTAATATAAATTVPQPPPAERRTSTNGYNSESDIMSIGGDGSIFSSTSTANQYPSPYR